MSRRLWASRPRQTAAASFSKLKTGFSPSGPKPKSVADVASPPGGAVHSFSRLVEAGNRQPSGPAFSAPVQRSVNAPDLNAFGGERRDAGPRLDVRKSAIHGNGLFSRDGHQPGEPIEVGAEAWKAADGRTSWEVTKAARYANHDSRPNAKVARIGGRLTMSAQRRIEPNGEVTVNYSQVGSALGPDQLTWKGQRVPNGSSREFWKNQG